MRNFIRNAIRAARLARLERADAAARAALYRDYTLANLADYGRANSALYVARHNV